MTVAARADEVNNLVSADMCSLYQEIAALAIYRIVGVLMSPTGSYIQAPGQLTHLSIPTLVLERRKYLSSLTYIYACVLNGLRPTPYSRLIVLEMRRLGKRGLTSADRKRSSRTVGAGVV